MKEGSGHPRNEIRVKAEGRQRPYMRVNLYGFTPGMVQLQGGPISGCPLRSTGMAVRESQESRCRGIPEKEFSSATTAFRDECRFQLISLLRMQAL